jgi:SAM-dependent methyltransferase
MKEIKLIKIDCPICGINTPYDIKYEANFKLDSLDFAAKKTSKHMYFRNVKCKKCNLIYSNPIIPFDQIKKFYQVTYFLELNQLEIMANDYEKLFYKYIPNISEITNVLEVGCANGLFLKRLEKRGIKKFKGVEPSKEAYSVTDNIIKPHIINDFLDNNLFENNSFDVACSFQTFDHVLEPNDFLQKIYKYIKPGGYFLQVHHNVNSLLPTLLGAKASTFDVEHIHLWSPKTMKLILEKNGFEIIKIKNITTGYLFGHALERLPLFPFLKKYLIKLTKWLKLNKLIIRFPVENMVIVSRKKII